MTYFSSGSPLKMSLRLTSATPLPRNTFVPSNSLAPFLHLPWISEYTEIVSPAFITRKKGKLHFSVLDFGRRKGKFPRWDRGGIKEGLSFQSILETIWLCEISFPNRKRLYFNFPNWRSTHFRKTKKQSKHLPWPEIFGQAEGWVPSICYSSP